MLRSYQMTAIDGDARWPGILRAWESERSTLVVMPTGTGKTEVFLDVARRRVGQGMVLIVSDRRGLVQQNAARARAAGMSAAIDMADARPEPLFRPQVVSASVQTLARPGRLAAYDPALVGTIIIDEADLAVADSYDALFDRFPGAKILGVTATPDRCDGRPLRERFGSVAFVYDIRAAITDGWLVPITAESIQVDGLDLSSVRVRAGDLDENEVAEILMEEENLHGVADPLVRKAGDRPTMVFCATVAHAKALAQVINRYKAGSAMALDGSMDDGERAGPIDAYVAGGLQFLCNCSLFTRGIDLVHTACVAMARPTKSRAFYAQAVGRGTRVLKGLVDGVDDAAARRAAIAGSGKRDLLILDFEGTAGRHSLVCPFDILDGNKDAEARARAREMLRQQPGADVIGVLDEASQQLAEEERERARRRMRAEVTARAQFTTARINPFRVVASTLGVRARPGRWAGEPPTPQQRMALERHGVGADGIDRGQAADMLDAIANRINRRVCPPGLAMQLIAAGLDPEVDVMTARRQLAQAGQQQRQPTRQQAAR